MWKGAGGDMTSSKSVKAPIELKVWHVKFSKGNHPRLKTGPPGPTGINSSAEEDPQPKKKARTANEKKSIKGHSLHRSLTSQKPLPISLETSLCPPDVSSASLVRSAEGGGWKTEKERGAMNLGTGAIPEKERPERSRAEFLPHTHPFASLSQEGEDRKGEETTKQGPSYPTGSHIQPPNSKSSVEGRWLAQGDKHPGHSPAGNLPPASHSRPQRAMKALLCSSFEKCSRSDLFSVQLLLSLGSEQAHHFPESLPALTQLDAGKPFQHLYTHPGHTPALFPLSIQQGS